MAKETFTGPLIALGGIAGGPGSQQPREYSDEIGPSIFWGGTAIVASGGPGTKDRTGPGSVSAVYAASPIRTINCAPAAGAAALTVAGLPTNGVPLVNITTYAGGRAPGTPVISGGVAALGVALDMGLDPVTTTTAATNNVTLATIANAWRYRVGQWIGILNGAVGGATLMTQITAITVATGVMTVVPPPGAGVATGVNGPQITLSNRYNYNQYGASGPPSSVSSTAAAGAARISIPELGTTRGVGVTAAAATTNGQVLIQGIGQFGMPVSELITTVAGSTVWGKKTYDVFVSATPQFSDATAGHNLTVVTSDFFGFPMSVMSVDSIVAMTFAGTAMVAANFTVIPADTTYPATQTTGDPRGGIQMTANGPAVALGLAAPVTPLTLNGTTGILVVDQRLNPLQVALATTINPGPLTGVPGV